MANLILNIGSVSVTVVLIVCAAFLLWDGRPDWVRFFNLGVYSGIWNLLWSVVQQVVRRTMDAEEGRRRIDSGSVLALYLLGFLISVVLTVVFARFIVRVI